MKEAARLADEPRVPARSALAVPQSGDDSDPAPVLPSLDSLPIHKSRLEREKEAAAAASASEGSAKSSPTRPKTALQREREAAAKLARKAARQAKREAAGAAAVETV